MASVAATARTGYFHQPVIVDPDLIEGTIAKSSRALQATAAQQLRSMMHLTATNGTAAPAMRGVYGTFVGAKTGSAEVGGQDKPNGWFTAYRDDVAAAGVVQQGGHGVDSAGPIVAAILKAS
jgi:cell division protein FtsI/penicillin-binding protein 2